uniref:Putative ovule protein n=1 Tax=Solanum chacoense TaxID=4108 RepID=A0A0V0H1A2_SOLCH
MIKFCFFTNDVVYQKYTFMSRDDKFLKFLRAFQGNHSGLGLIGKNMNSAHCLTPEVKYMNLVCQSRITYGH